VHDAETAALYDLIAPELEYWERAVRIAEPSLPEPEVLDRALRNALVALRRDVSRESFAYLKWRAEKAAAAAAATRAAAEALRGASSATRAAARERRAEAAVRAPFVGDHASASPAGGPPKVFHDGDGRSWTVQEIACADVLWARGPHCLLFQSDTAIRRVWHYPTEWRGLSDEELERLSWLV
jgi:hypothetical protein